MNSLLFFGLLIAVIDPTAEDFVIGSHGITNVDSIEGSASWLPIAPDVAISLAGNYANTYIDVYSQEFC